MEGGYGVRMPRGYQPASLADRPRGEAPGLRTWDAWLHFPPVYGCDVPACFPPFARFYFPCLEFSSNPSGHPGRESAGKKFPHPSGWPTRQGRGCPGLTLFLFLPGEPTAGRLGTWRKGRASQLWGPLFPRPQGLRGQRSPGLR